MMMMMMTTLPGMMKVSLAYDSRGIQSEEGLDSMNCNQGMEESSERDGGQLSSSILFVEGRAQ